MKAAQAFGVKAPAIQAGPVETDMNSADSDFGRMLIARAMALPRYGSGEEIASLVA